MTALFASSMMAATSTLTFTKACGGAGTADDGAEWVVTSDALESTYDAARGIHYGTGSATVQYLQLETDDIEGTITKVVVNASDALGKATISVSVGGTDLTGATTVTNSNPGADYTFTGSASGKIVVRIDRGAAEKKALYVKSVVVTYSTPAPIPTTRDLYLTLSSDWAGWPAKYAVYYFDDETNGWSDFMTEVEGETNMLTTSIPIAYSKIIFVRLDGAATEVGWGSKWSQTVNLTIPDGKNAFTVTSGGTGDECDGNWAKFPAA